MSWMESWMWGDSCLVPCGVTHAWCHGVGGGQVQYLKSPYHGAPYPTRTAVSYMHCRILHALPYPTRSAVSYTHCRILHALPYPTRTAVSYTHCRILHTMPYPIRSPKTAVSVSVSPCPPPLPSPHSSSPPPPHLQAVVYPVVGLYTVNDFWGEVLSMYRGEVPQPSSTQWRCLDPLYKVAPGEVTIVSGSEGGGG